MLAQAIIAAVIGAAGALFGVWLRWGIEKERMRIKRRQALVVQWRQELFENWDSNQQMDDSLPKYKFMQSQAFVSLYPHLSKEFLERLSHRRTLYVGVDPVRDDLAREIGRIEQEWNLV